jgi:hypothetical protein
LCSGLNLRRLTTNRLQVSALMAVLISLMVLVVGAAAAPKAGPYTVTATVFNCCDANSHNFMFQSDGAVSSAYSSATPGVLSELSGNISYEWVLDLTQSSRSFLLTLSPVNGSPSGPFVGTLGFNGKLRSRCFDPSNSVFSWLKIHTQDTNCAMRVDFTYGTVNYTLVMSPIEPGTGTATVACTNWNGSACSAWTDVSTAGVANANVAHLYAITRKGQTYVGSYALSFNVTMVHP